MVLTHFGGKIKLLLSGFTVDPVYTGRSSQFRTESEPGSAHPDSVLRLRFNADGWGKASSVPGHPDCCVGCYVDGTVCVCATFSFQHQYHFQHLSVVQMLSS